MRRHGWPSSERVVSCVHNPQQTEKKGGVAVKRWITDRRWEEGGRSEVGPHCNLTGPIPTSAPAAVLWGEA